MKKATILALLLICSADAYAWSATYLGGNPALWHIKCANGTDHSYSGSSAGLDIVGPELCPGGVVGSGPRTQPVWTVEKVEREIISKRKAPPKLRQEKLGIKD